MGAQAATIVGIAAGVVVIAFIVLMTAGVVLLVRRARREAAAGPSGSTEAGVALVRADDALKDGADDLAFALAQFGEDRTRDFAKALAQAKTDLAAAFRLQQQLNDVTPDTEQQRLDWTRRIRVLADRARTSVQQQSAAFEQLRVAEATAPQRLTELRDRVTALTARRAASAATLDAMKKEYVGAATAAVAGNLAAVDSAIADAGKAADDAATALALSRVPNVGDILQRGDDAARSATQLLDAVDHRRDELAAADTSLAALITEQKAAVAAAKALRDAPPDPDSSASVNQAIADVEAQLSAASKAGRRDPVNQLDALVDASDRLDVAVSAAQNQQRRLDGARQALAGALVSATTQIAAVTDYIAAHRGGVGADARTRLAEAQRQLELARNEADPVDALDGARRAQTCARDADALARYDAARWS